MKLSFLPNLFSKYKKSLKTPDSIILKELKSVNEQSDILVYEEITIYHHSKSFFIPLLLLDPSRGIYLFEHKDWSYDDLKNAKIEKATHQDASEETLAFEKSHEFIQQKFYEITQKACVPIHNFLIMGHLNSSQYEHLDASFKELLPQERIMFNDLSKEEIIKKIKNIHMPKETLPSVSDIMGNILVQYTILDSQNNLHMATREQQAFIDAPFSSFEILSSSTGSGKTTSILLKIIVQKLRNPNLRIMIIKPTTLSCDLLKRKFIHLVDRACFEFSITEIEIITPFELLNRHLKKLKKPTLESEVHVSEILMNKEFDVADVILCDDSDMLSNEFKYYLKHIQRKSNLLLVKSAKLLHETYAFSKNFVKEKKKVIFTQANPHAKALQIIASLLESHMPKEILVVCNALSKEKLSDDLEYFIKDKAILLDSSKKLIDQDLNHLLIATYSEINSIDARFVILMDVCFASLVELEYAFNICQESVYVLYDDECEKLNSLRSDFEE